MNEDKICRIGDGSFCDKMSQKEPFLMRQNVAKRTVPNATLVAIDLDGTLLNSYG